MLAVIVNMATVIAGSLIGIFLRSRLKESFRLGIMKALALCTVIIGITSAIGTGDILCVIISMAVGTALGEALRIDDGIDHLGDGIKNKLFKNGGGGSRFTVALSRPASCFASVL